MSFRVAPGSNKEEDIYIERDVPAGEENMNKKLESKTYNLQRLMSRRHPSMTIETYVDYNMSRPLVAMYVSYEGVSATFYMGDLIPSVEMRSIAELNISAVMDSAVKNFLSGYTR